MGRRREQQYSFARPSRALWPTNLDEVFFRGGYEFGTFRNIYRYLKHELRLPLSREVSYAHWRRGMSEDYVVAAGSSAISA
jgi:hypothetical protein